MGIREDVIAAGREASEQWDQGHRVMSAIDPALVDRRDHIAIQAAKVAVKFVLGDPAQCGPEHAVHRHLASLDEHWCVLCDSSTCPHVPSGQAEASAEASAKAAREGADTAYRLLGETQRKLAAAQRKLDAMTQADNTIAQPGVWMSLPGEDNLRTHRAAQPQEQAAERIGQAEMAQGRDSGHDHDLLDSPFGTRLFNFCSLDGLSGMAFSKRTRIVRAMLAAMDRAFAEERPPRLPANQTPPFHPSPPRGW